MVVNAYQNHLNLDTQLDVLKWTNGDLVILIKISIF